MPEIAEAALRSHELVNARGDELADGVAACSIEYFHGRQAAIVRIVENHARLCLVAVASASSLRVLITVTTGTGPRLG